VTNNRYSINDFMIMDMDADPVKAVYIRELLDFSSDEFQRSKLSKQQKITIIDALGLGTLTDVLHECFINMGASYNATSEAYLAYSDLSDRSDKIRQAEALKPTEKFCKLFKDKKIESLTIGELADWRDSDIGSTLLLPPIQRSVVWTNEQVINYWDSLLRGYPAGMMMVHRVQIGHGDLKSEGRDKDGNTREANKNDFQLFDGQQRMAAVLLGFGKGQMKDGRKLWVDLGQPPKPSSGLRFQLRMTSIGQPFGYRADSPNQKIELGKRYDKWSEWRNQYGEMAAPQQAFSEAKGSDLIDSKCAVPFAEVCNRVREESPNVLIEELSKLEGIDPDTVEKFVIKLTEALMSTVVLQEVALDIVANQEEYIRYFGRLGQGGTRLSDDELTYSIIKQQFPKIHDQMQKIMHGPVGRLANEVDLVLAAVRVSKTLEPWNTPHEWEIIGRPNPTTISQLHDKDAVLRKFFELIPLDTNKTGVLEMSLLGIRRALSFDAIDHSTGLPSMLLARLPRELVDVLILFSVKRGAEKSWEGDDRAMLCSFVLYWLFFVANDSKAAWRAFRHVRNENWAFGQVAISKLIKEFEDDGVANFIPRMSNLQKLQDEVMSEVEKELPILRLWADRFKAADFDSDRKPGEALRVLSTNRELIQRALMWLQRKYIAENYSNYDPTSDRDDDLPVDLDHIIPYDIFGFDWRYADKRLNADVISDNFRWQRFVVGNSLGNFRWLDSRENRARGKGSYEPLKNNADLVLNPDDWNKIIPNDTTKECWSKEHIVTFQRLIDSRTLDLFKKILTEGGIEKILPLEASPLG